MVTIVDPMGWRIETGQDGGQSWCGPGGGAVGVFENRASLGPGIDVGSGLLGMAVATESIGSTRVNGEEEDILCQGPPKSGQ